MQINRLHKSKRFNKTNICNTIHKTDNVNNTIDLINDLNSISDYLKNMFVFKAPSKINKIMKIRNNNQS